VEEMADPYTRSYAGGLAEELEAYERRGDEERAAAVRSELARVRSLLVDEGAEEGGGSSAAEVETTAVEPRGGRRRTRRVD
jgi:hypothetical protein